MAAVDPVLELMTEWACTVREVHVTAGENVSIDQELLLVESMKMLIPVVSPRSGTVVEVFVEVDQVMDEGHALVSISAE